MEKERDETGSRRREVGHRKKGSRGEGEEEERGGEGSDPDRRQQQRACLKGTTSSEDSHGDLKHKELCLTCLLGEAASSPHLGWIPHTNTRLGPPLSFPEDQLLSYRPGRLCFCSVHPHRRLYSHFRRSRAYRRKYRRNRWDGGEGQGGANSTGRGGSAGGLVEIAWQSSRWRRCVRRKAESSSPCHMRREILLMWFRTPTPLHVPTFATWNYVVRLQHLSCAFELLPFVPSGNAFMLAELPRSPRPAWCKHPSKVDRRCSSSIIMVKRHTSHRVVSCT